jgi:hypothetical protein
MTTPLDISSATMVFKARSEAAAMLLISIAFPAMVKSLGCLKMAQAWAAFNRVLVLFQPLFLTPELTVQV